MATWKKILTEDSSGDVTVSNDLEIEGNQLQFTNTDTLSKIEFSRGAIITNDVNVLQFSNEGIYKFIGLEGQSCNIYLHADNGDDDNDKWNIAALPSNQTLSFKSHNGSTYVNALTLSGAGDVVLTGDLTVTGNDIKSSSNTAITLSGQDVTIAGDLQVTGNNITGSDGLGLIEFSGNDLKLSDNVYLNSDLARIYFGSSSSEALSIQGESENIKIHLAGDNTNLPEHPLKISADSSSGSLTTGFGVGIQFDAESLGGMHTLGELTFKYGTPNAGIEDSTLSIKTMEDGSLSREWQFTGNKFEFPNTVQIEGANAGALTIMSLDSLTLSSSGGGGEDVAINLLPGSGYDSQINFYESVSSRWTIGNDGSDDTNHKFHFDWADTDVGDNSIFAIGSSGFVTLKNGATIANTASGTLNISAVGNHTGHLVARHMTSTFGTTGNMVLSDNSIEVAGLLKIDTTGDITLETDTGHIHFDSDLTHSGGHLGKISDEAIRTAFYLYEKAGESTDDYFKITVAEKGATILSTTDASVAFGEGTDADIKIAPDGEIHLVGSQGTIGSNTNIKFFQDSDQIGVFSRHHSMHDFTIFAYDDLLKHLSINVDGDGSAKFTTHDGGVVTHDADITLNPDGQLKLKSWGDIDIYNGQVITTPAFKLGMSVGSASEFWMFESSGASNDDYFKIKVGTHGETIIDTVDASVGGVGANLTFNIDGNCTVNSESDIILDATRSVILETDTAQILLNPSSYVEVMKPIMIKETASPETHSASFGQIYVKNASPAQLWYQDDTGVNSRLDNQGGGGTSYHYMQHQWYTNSNANVYIPFAASTNDSNSVADFYIDDTVWIAPFDGKLTKFQLYTDSATFSTDLKLSVNGTLGSSMLSGGAQNCPLNKYVFTFTCDQNNTFSAGDVVRLWIEPTNDPLWSTASTTWEIS